MKRPANKTVIIVCSCSSDAKLVYSIRDELMLETLFTASSQREHILLHMHLCLATFRVCRLPPIYIAICPDFPLRLLESQSVETAPSSRRVRTPTSATFRVRGDLFERRKIDEKYHFHIHVRPTDAQTARTVIRDERWSDVMASKRNRSKYHVGGELSEAKEKCVWT